MDWVLKHFVLAFLAATIFFSSFSYSYQAPGYNFIKQAASAPAISFYDYIVIGGGTAGCALAATLSQGGRVLVLERGESPYRDPDRFNATNLLNTQSQTNPSLYIQQFVSTDGVFNVRARILGGGTVVNGGFYSRASSRYIAAAGWDKSLVRESYEWVEKKIVFKPQILRWQSAVRDGLLEARVLPDNGFTYDHLNGTKVGGTIFDKEGNRHTAANLLQYADSRRISVYLHATVEKILFRNNGKRRKPRAYGVIFKDASGIKHRAYLSRKSTNEIILSAGALGSPQLLMLSGIGPAQHLRAHGIKVVLDQPLVGQGMADNPMNTLFVPSPIAFEVSTIQMVGITKSENFIETIGGWHVEVPSNVTAETLRPFANQTLRGGIIFEKFKGPYSRGHLELRTTNASDNPSVTFNYFKDPKDLRLCVEGMKTIIHAINSRALSKFRHPFMTIQALKDLMRSTPRNQRPQHPSAEYSLEQFCIDTVTTFWHYHGGCQVGKVVDHDYKVIGVDSLRVIDGSTFLAAPGTNPQATVMMLGRYMGQKILHKRFP